MCQSLRKTKSCIQVALNLSEDRGAIGGKTGKTVVLPGFCKIEHGGGSGGAPPYYRGLTWLGLCSVLQIQHLFPNCMCSCNMIGVFFAQSILYLSINCKKNPCNISMIE